MTIYQKLAGLLQTKPEILENLDRAMNAKTAKTGVFERVYADNEKHVEKMLVALKGQEQTQHNLREILRDVMLRHERQVIEYVDAQPGQGRFEKAVQVAKNIAKVNTGFFLKKELAKDILRKRTPENLLLYLKLKTVDEVFSRYDVTEAFSALRFIESNEWMHETFEKAYSRFTADDFEEREIEIRALGSEWHEIAEKFLKKKRHNVSHLKEFGVIFLNPAQEEAPGKFFRDFALLFHYLHEVDFYAKMFRRYAEQENFADKLKSLLRGDILEVTKTEGAEWLIVQRYLDKENKNDPRLLLPRVNPESLHWARAERDLTRLGEREESIDLELWKGLDWVACQLNGDSPGLVSFDLEDTAMSLVSFYEGNEQFYSYHQREAMWTKIFQEYVGGEAEVEKFLVNNFDQGIIRF